MTPEQRKNARARLDLFLSPNAGDTDRVSRAELAGYLKDALDQIGDDEALMRDALFLIGGWVPERVKRTYSFVDALRARLGEAASDPATPAQRPGLEGKVARPKWCSHADCSFLIGWQNMVCGGRLPAPVRHEDDFNTHRICFKLPAEVLDLQVNRNDCWLIGLVTQKLREEEPPARDGEAAQGEEADDGKAKAG